MPADHVQAHRPPLAPEPPAARRSGRLALLAIAVAIGGLGLIYAFADAHRLLDVAAGIAWPRVALPIAASLLSYAVMAISYESIAAIAGAGIGLSRMLRITFVSNTVNYLIATAGLSGLVVRMYFFRQSGMPMSRALTISFVQGLLTYLSLLGFLILGFLFLLMHRSVGPTLLLTGAVSLAIFGIAVLLCMALIARSGMRRRLLTRTTAMIGTIARRTLPRRFHPREDRLSLLALNLDDGFAFMVANWRRMVAPTTYIVVDWLLTVAALWGCFWCVGLDVPLPLVLIGFSVGTLFSIVSIVPGGVGVMEPAMTFAFHSLGIPLEATVIAVLLFRLTYHFIPLLISLAFFRSMLRVARIEATEALTGDA